MLHDPELLLLDEPTVGVDPQSRNKIFESIEALHREGRTIIYTTHYMEEAERLCDRIAIVDAGKLLALGTLQRAARHARRPADADRQDQRRGTAAADRRSARRAQSHRRATRRSTAFQMERPTLEQVFLRLTGRSLQRLITMKQVIALAFKDLRLMPRNRGGMFFTFVWPILVTVLFGIMFGGNDDGEQGKIRIAIVDEDNTDGSRAFLTKLEESFELSPMTAADAENAVRRGQRTGFIVVKPGFGEASNRMFYGSPKEIEVGVDPAPPGRGRHARRPADETCGRRHAEDVHRPAGVGGDGRQGAGRHASRRRADQVAPVQRFLGELKTFMGTPQSQGPPGSPQGEWQPLKITKKDVARVYDGPRNPFDITFPQGVIWGLIGCVMSFGISLVTERTHGTLVRLRMAPLTRAQILGGKALACFSSILFVEVMLLGVALALRRAAHRRTRSSRWPGCRRRSASSAS